MTTYSASPESLSTWSTPSQVIRSLPPRAPTQPVAAPQRFEVSSTTSSSSSESSNDDLYHYIDDADDELSLSGFTAFATNARIAGLVESNKTLALDNYFLRKENRQLQSKHENLVIQLFFLCGACFTLVVFLAWTVYILRA